MAKFSDVTQGVRARKSIKLPLPGAQLDDSAQWTGPTVDLDLRPLRDDEYAEILQHARAFAKERGVDDPKDDNEIYERGKMVHTLAIACIDKDSPLEKPEPFFDGGWKQVHTSELMTPEVVGYLYGQQELWQDEINPLIGDMQPEQFLAAAIKTAGGDMGFFVNSRPGMRWIFARTLSSQLVASLARRSPSSPPSESQTPTPS